MRKAACMICCGCAFLRAICMMRLCVRERVGVERKILIEHGGQNLNCQPINCLSHDSSRQRLGVTHRWKLSFLSGPRN